VNIFALLYEAVRAIRKRDRPTLIHVYLRLFKPEVFAACKPSWDAVCADSLAAQLKPPTWLNYVLSHVKTIVDSPVPVLDVCDHQSKVEQAKHLHDKGYPIGGQPVPQPQPSAEEFERYVLSLISECVTNITI
jgi:hypothetical protein